MSLKYIAVQGCTLDCPQAQITTPPKTKVKCGSKNAYAGQLTINISGYAGQGITDGNGSGSAILSGSATKVKIENEYAVLEGDKVDVPVTGTASGTPVPVTVTVTITAAGQTNVKGS